MICEEFVVV